MTEFDRDAIISTTDHLQLLAEKMEDEQFYEAIKYIKQLISKPDVPVSRVDDTIVKLQAISANFALGATWYKTFGKDGVSERYKKDVYYTTREALDKLVDALKYIVRVQNRG